ncbi:unnamed protein product, partial [Oppiella nova]
MSVIHRSLFTLLSVALFVVLIALKVDNKSEWNWFVVMAPMYVLDVVMTAMVAIKWLRPSQSYSNTMSWRRGLSKRLYCLTIVLCKLSFQVMSCLRLQYITHLPLYI